MRRNWNEWFGRLHPTGPGGLLVNNRRIRRESCVLIKSLSWLLHCRKSASRPVAVIWTFVPFDMSP